jgi:hypothetical protein
MSKLRYSLEITADDNIDLLQKTAAALEIIRNSPNWVKFVRNNLPDSQLQLSHGAIVYIEDPADDEPNEEED